MSCAAAPAPPPRRVVLITVDTLRADHLGSYGAEAAHTPHLDALAAAGVRFEEAISPAPLTLPAHATLLTGLDPPRHGVRHNAVHRLAPEIPTLAESMRAAGYSTAAFVGARVLDRRFGLARGFDHYDDRSGARLSAPVVGWSERRAGDVVDAALAWLESAPERFFVWIHVYDPHADYAPPPGFAAAFPGDPYAGEIAYVDHALGRWLDALRATTVPTLLVVTSDHGESLGEHGEPTHSHTLYDATQRVPLLVVGPGWRPGAVVAGPVRLSDLTPTLLASVGAPPLPDLDGESLLPLRAGGEGAPRLAYLETLATHLDFGWSPLAGVRDARWKYLRAPRPELYDLRADPGETRDLAAERPAVVSRLEARLAALLARERAPDAAPALDAATREQLRALGYAPGPGPAASTRSSGPDPKDGVAWLARLARAEARAAAGDWAGARALLHGDSEAPAVLAMRAALALRAGDRAAAERDARAALRRDPRREDVRALLLRAREGGER